MKKNIDIKNLKTAKKYALAFLEAQDNSGSETVHDLEFVQDVIFQNEDFENFFFHPVISSRDKKSVIEEALEGKINPKTLNFLEILLDEGRFNLFKTIFEEYKELYDKIQNKQRVEIISAIGLQEEAKTKLEQKLAQKLSKDVILNFQEDKSIIGGLVIKFEDKVIDLSLKAKFASLKMN